MRRVVVDLDAGPMIVEMDDQVLVGSCKRCGACCAVMMDGDPCPHLNYETVDDNPLYRCGIYEARPIGCVLWPRTDLDLPEVCGFSWKSKAKWGKKR